jgi:hypothetical protein
MKKFFAYIKKLFNIMKRYLKFFENANDYNNQKQDAMEIPHVALVDKEVVFKPLEFNLVDGEIYENTTDFKQVTVTYRRNFKNTNLQAWYVPFDVDVTALKDKGYFYLCKDSDGELFPLSEGNSAIFLWNDAFIIPWQLTNTAAEKKIFVGLSFQAIQTYIPQMKLSSGSSTGVIVGDADNKLPQADCKYNHVSVQTVFNSCNFTPINTQIGDINFADGNYDNVSAPSITIPAPEPEEPAGE